MFMYSLSLPLLAFASFAWEAQLTNPQKTNQTKLLLD